MSLGLVSGPSWLCQFCWSGEECLWSQGSDSPYPQPLTSACLVHKMVTLYSSPWQWAGGDSGAYEARQRPPPCSLDICVASPVLSLISLSSTGYHKLRFKPNILPAAGHCLLLAKPQ